MARGIGIIGIGFVHQVVVLQRIEPLQCNEIFVISRFKFANARSRRLVDSNDPCVSCSASAGVFFFRNGSLFAKSFEPYKV